jgi:hypothetical protein
MLAGARSPAATWCETLSSRPSMGATSTAICATTACGRRSSSFLPPRTTGSPAWRCPTCIPLARTHAAASTSSPARGPCIGCTSRANPTRRPVFPRRSRRPNLSRRVLSRLVPCRRVPCRIRHRRLPRPRRCGSLPAGCLASSACELPPRGRASGGQTAASAGCDTDDLRALAGSCSPRPLGPAPVALGGPGSASRSAAARGTSAARAPSVSPGACARSARSRASATTSAA